MYILNLVQGDYEVRIGAFEDIDEGVDFISKLNAYETEIEEDDIMYQYINPSKLEEYTELEVNGNIVPFSKYMFPNDEIVEISWSQMPNLSKKGNGMVDDLTRIDAYNIENEDVKEYIEKREENYNKAKKYLEEKGYAVTRSYFGSEDGEAILYRNKEEKNEDWHFLTHMDPNFVDEENIEEMIEDIFNEEA